MSYALLCQVVALQVLERAEIVGRQVIFHTSGTGFLISVKSRAKNSLFVILLCQIICNMSYIYQFF